MTWTAWSDEEGVLRTGLDCKVREPRASAELAICQSGRGRSERQAVSVQQPAQGRMSETLQVTDTIAIPRTELLYRASRSGGAGGQHVNTSSTRIELLWDFRRSPSLTDS